jgi:hydroxymethylbilane synthase
MSSRRREKGKSMRFRLGTRTSALAKVQATQILESLAREGISCEMIEIESSGDKNRGTPLYEFELESPGLFTKQLEVALLRDEIDLAVHSLKDLPTEQPAGLVIASVPARAGTGDCLVLSTERFDPSQPLGLPNGARVGTSSLRRQAQLLWRRPDLKVEPIRGNVPTRVRSAREGRYDAVVLAEAGLSRLGLDQEGVRKLDLPEDLFVSAPGQGAIAVETRKEIPDELSVALGRIHHEATFVETRIERRVLRGLHGGCTLPLGVRCVRAGGIFHLKAFLGLERERGRGEWLSFHPFDISAPDEDRVVESTIAHFKGVMDGAF